VGLPVHSASRTVPLPPAGACIASAQESAPDCALSENAASHQKVLLVDDDDLICRFLERALAPRGCHVVSEPSADDAVQRLDSEGFDVVVTDLNLVGVDGLAFTKSVVAAHPDVPVILMTGGATMEIAIAALRAGAWDFLLKPIDLKLLELSIDRARKHRALRAEVQRLRRLVPGAPGRRIIGSSEPMKRVDDLIARVAPSPASVLICGDSGTGKELVAAAIHFASSCSDGPFIAINCAAMPAALLEAELFGHTKGAFTDARSDRKGLFVQADGGTLFLDEIGDLPLEMQPKLLRALQERKVRPLGGTAEISFDARIITATNRDLDTEVHEKRFREDLFYRINVVRIEVPPLRERQSDVLQLAQHFIERASARASHPVKGLAPAAAAKLLAYDWPGNVRELENCIESAVALTRSDELAVEDLPVKVRQFQTQRVVLAAETAEDLVSLEELNQRYLGKVLGLLSGNKTRAAKTLGVDRRTLYRMLSRAEGVP
jgi:two-component system, NtrC family, response regulator HydG